MPLNRPVGLSFIHSLGLSRTSSRIRARAAGLTGTKTGQTKLVNVSYPDHHKVFTERIWELFTNKSKIDLEIGGVGVHQLILELFIPQLTKLLEAATDPDGNTAGLDLGLNECNAADDFLLLVEFIYRGTLVGVSSQQLESLQKLTDKLKVPLEVEDTTGRDAEETLTTPESPTYGAARLLNGRGMIPQVPAEKRHLWQPEETGVAAPLTCKYVIRPRVPKKKSSEDPTATGREWLKVDEALNAVPEGATVILRGNREIRRDRLSAKRRREATAAWSRETDESVQSITVDDSGTSELTAAPGIESAVMMDESSCEMTINPEEAVAATSSTAVTSTEAVSTYKSSETLDVDEVPAVVSGSGNGEETASELPVAATAKVARVVKAGALQKCPKCPYQTQYRHRYASHLKNNHDPSRVLLKCNSCDRLFATKEGMERHLLTHKDDQQTYECKHCDYKTPRKANFLRHMAGKHNRTVDDELIPAKFHCDVCSYGCAHKSQLISHVVHEHSAAAAPFKCPHCSYGSIRYSNLEKHVNSVHLNYRPMMCHTCGRGFSNQFALKVHVRIHTKERPYRCRIPGCDKAFSDPTGLKRHHVSHGNHKPFVCDQCGYACKIRYNLRAHLKRHEKAAEANAN